MKIILKIDTDSDSFKAVPNKEIDNIAKELRTFLILKTTRASSTPRLERKIFDANGNAIGSIVVEEYQ